jgi:glycosyltransferase involved in cell wall biosynthesis
VDIIPRFVRLILGCEAFRKAEVVVAGRPELLDHPELRNTGKSFRPHYVHLSARQEALLSNASSIASQARRQFALWKIWQGVYDDVSRTAPVELVVVPSADDSLYAVPFVGSAFRAAPWLGIVHAQKFHLCRVGVSAPKPRLSGLREWLFRRALHDRFLLGVLTVDPTLEEYANTQFSTLERERIAFLPDAMAEHILPSAASAQRSLGIPQDVKVVLVYGALSERKGIRTLIGCANSSECPSNVYVLLAGQQDPMIAEFLAGEASTSLRGQNRLTIINGYVLEADEARLLAAADCLWVGYRGFYTWSGAMVLAGRHGIPCLVTNRGVAGYMASKHDFGLIIDVDNSETVLTALKAVSQHPENLAVKGQRAKSLFSRHTISEFQRTISTMIETSDPISPSRTNED